MVGKLMEDRAMKEICGFWMLVFTDNHPFIEMRGGVGAESKEGAPRRL